MFRERSNWGTYRIRGSSVQVPAGGSRVDAVACAVSMFHEPTAILSLAASLSTRVLGYGLRYAVLSFPRVYLRGCGSMDGYRSWNLFWRAFKHAARLEAAGKADWLRLGQVHRSAAELVAACSAHCRRRKFALRWMVSSIDIYPEHV